MQVHIVKQMPSVKARYLDPQAIAQTNFNYPKQCTLDAKELAAAKTLREKERIRTAKLREESFNVVAYIALGFQNSLTTLYYMTTIQLRVSSTLYLKLCSIYFIRCKRAYLVL